MKRALIVVDMINDFIDEKGVLSLKEAGFDIVPVVKERLNDYRTEGDMVVFISDSHPENDTEFERFPPHAIEGTWGSEVIDELEPECDEYIVNKTRFSGFFETELEMLLADNEIDEVELVGCCTSICVAQTAADLANRDYGVFLYRGAVADFNQEAHDFYLNYQLPVIFGVDVR